MKQCHSRIVDFIHETKSITGIKVLEKAKDAPSRKCHIILVNTLADAFAIAPGLCSGMFKHVFIQSYEHVFL